MRMILIKAAAALGRQAEHQNGRHSTNSYIICPENPSAPPMFEIAPCDTEIEARDWADQLLAFAPGFQVGRILAPRGAADAH